MKKFEWKPFLKNVAVIAVPVALQNLLTTTGSMVDTIMLAPLGQNTVGAVGLCAQLTSLLFSCYWGFVGGGMLFFAQYFGAKDDDGINRSYGMTLTCMMTVGIVFAAAALLFPEAVMRVYTDKTSIQEIGVRYLRVVGFAYPLQVLSMAMSALLRSTGRVRIPLFGAIASVCTNIALNWVLIYGHLGLPAMGIQGAALATAIAATAVFRTLEGFVIGFFSGFSNAASVLVGTQVGAGNLETAYERAKRLVYLCGSIILMACLFLLAVHRPLLHVMSLEGESFRIGSGMLAIYCGAAVIRMCNWTQNDTYRSAGDAAYGTILEITFMYAMLLPCVYLTGMVWKAPFLIVFACCYIDEPIRFVLMQIHLFSGKWIKPVTPQGREALAEFFEKRRAARRRAA